MSVATSYSSSGRVNFGWIGESFEIYKRDAGVWSFSVLISLLSGFAISFIFNIAFYTAEIPSIIVNHTVDPAARQNPISQIFVFVLNLAIESFFYAGLFTMANKAVRGQRLNISDLFSGAPQLLSILFYKLGYLLLMLAGYIACGVGAFFSWYLFWPGFALVADGEEPGVAFSRVFEGMKQDVWNGAAFAFALGVVVVLSCLPCFLGWFVTYPMSIIIAALACRDMIKPIAPPSAEVQPGSWPPPPTEGPS